MPFERDPTTVGQLTIRLWNRKKQALIAGTRVPTSAIWSFAEIGCSVDEIHREYPDLERADIEAALDHERKILRKPNGKPLQRQLP